MQLCSRLPAEPLQQAIARKKRVLNLTWGELGIRLGVTERTLHRVMSDPWVGFAAADHMAFRLELHPTNLWPQEWGALASGRGQKQSRER